MKKIISITLVGIILLSTFLSVFADTYTVKEGDVLWRIAQDHNTTVEEIAKLNDLENVNLIQVDQVLKLNEDQMQSTSTGQVRSEVVRFDSHGDEIVGDLYYPADYNENQTYTAIVVTGSWTTVKEQMAGLYAERFAREGFIALAYDPRNFGESQGDIRNFESPALKIEDVKSAVTFLTSLDSVESIGAFGVCAGAGYTLVAASEDDRIQAVATAASWIHDEEAVKLFYGGEEGVNAKIAQAQAAKELFETTGEVQYIKKISTTDETAAMFGPYDYYLNPERGGIEEWQPDYFALMTWEEWLTFNPRLSAKNLDTPTLMIHSDGAVLPEYTKIYFNEINTIEKKLIWVGTDLLPSPYHQFSFYDQEKEVSLSVAESTQWFNEILK
ncbi:LysM peptidoglycan-binding domain-containing protein [Acidaminobacter sp. JC074]|uniref:LysM peptidoglycan-binding domain-containing protein n=1 Tax=Acidaminobacter sp. JC074 TaxID=2530199 RepID=UPI001F0E6FA9|nr:LysM peptidoglycan-binding domain-containing protein [Acidaminobacter sp. JC074]